MPSKVLIFKFYRKNHFHSQFVVIAPFRIRQGQPFNVFVTRFGVKKTISVKITITGNTDSGVPFTPIEKKVTIDYYSSQKWVTIDVSLS